MDSAGNHGDHFAGIPWRSRTRQEDGAHTEKRILKGLGALQHPRSGAGDIKEDGHDDHHLYEVKDARKSFTLKAGDLRQSFVRAVRQDKNAVWLIYFSDCQFTAEVRLVPGGKEMLGA